MKLYLAAILVLATVSFSGASPRAAAPDLLAEPMVDLAGESASLADYRGEVLVVNFWASWCAPCRDELPVLDAWNTEWAGTGARVVAVSLDKRIDNAKRFVADTGPGPDHPGRRTRRPGRRTRPDRRAHHLPAGSRRPAWSWWSAVSKRMNSLRLKSAAEDLAGVLRKEGKRMIISRHHLNRLLGAAALAALLGTAGCASVKPYEKEHLADPLMLDSFAIDDDLHEHEVARSPRGFDRRRRRRRRRVCVQMTSPSGRNPLLLVGPLGDGRGGAGVCPAKSRHGVLFLELVLRCRRRERLHPLPRLRA